VSSSTWPPIVIAQCRNRFDVMINVMVDLISSHHVQPLPQSVAFRRHRSYFSRLKVKHIHNTYKDLQIFYDSCLLTTHRFTFSIRNDVFQPANPQWPRRRRLSPSSWNVTTVSTNIGLSGSVDEIRPHFSAHALSTQFPIQTP
jgi:hypothetical protein